MNATQQADLADVLEAKGLRATRRRLEVLGALASERDDATAQGLWKRLREQGESTIGLATVYRTLTLLAGSGVVDVLTHHDGELCYRLCGNGHHHHLVCSSCHRVVEIEECGLDDWLEKVSAEHGFVPTGHRLELTGLCADCR